MIYNNQNDDSVLEGILLRVQFNSEINDLYQSIEEGEFFHNIELEFKGKNSILINIIIDGSGDSENIFNNLGVSDIQGLNDLMAEDRIFSRIIKELTARNLGWEFRLNAIKEKIIKGYILQLSVFKK